MLPSRGLIVIAFLLFIPLGCSPSSTSMHNDTSPVPADLKIVIGEGGGFTGLWSGYSIVADDTVFEWKGKSFGDNPVFAGRLPHDSLEALWQVIQELQLLERPSNVIRANYVQALAVSAHGSEHMFAWEPSMSADSTMSSASAIRARCLSAVRNSLQR